MVANSAWAPKSAFRPIASTRAATGVYDDRCGPIIRDWLSERGFDVADPAAVKQVLLNLCFNAIQAAELKTGDRWLLVSTRNTSSGIELAVSDSGPGIPEEVRAKLFQPFQTTKSSGFGLGLAICKDILGNLNAGINVDPPAPGRGASFRVIFPCRPS